MKHTKGYWERNGTFVYALNDKGFNRFDCNVQGTNAPREELLANAQLMAAAPDLLTACENALEIVAGERIVYDAFPPKNELAKIHEEYVRKYEKELEVVIAKAKGN